MHTSVELKTSSAKVLMITLLIFWSSVGTKHVGVWVYSYMRVHEIIIAENT